MIVFDWKPYKHAKEHYVRKRREEHMKKYSVVVNGTAYEVEIEEMNASEAVKNASAPSPAPASSGSGEVIKAPMPGNILDVRIKAGDQVRSGQVLMILEAMKMENEIMCPHDGKIISVAVSKGDTVEPDTVLCVLG